ncbi:glycosyltransferase [Kaistella sp. G5-32]|uniref:Glycosyltransferase n=1 Tax=Kaistella gelatinilytica TaxID=2787636 RepID=A0ABS0F8X5_9FLAO|nr:glycosyltransferase [Kaistella gelatinilytica]MBF8456154.1 glycosyltransferase [Kaistella gelatinilytica]
MYKFNNDLKLTEYDLIVFCHLRWDFVYQRPQHLISRLSKKYKVLVIEEPVGKRENRNLNIKEISPSLHILQPEIDHLSELSAYIKPLLKNKIYPVGWFYSAAFVDVLETFDFETIVYDCMDELSLFKGASQELIQQENKLLSAADVVYTGGKSLYESKKLKHHNVHCFPSSVEVNHFSETNATEIPEDMKNIPSPIIGYYGVIDERIDLDLLQKSAAKLPNHSFVMIGPICKIEEHELPQAENIFYLGMKSYDELPNYLNHFDFAMMPFALNDATKFISPTKTLEYMCAYKPIISTKITDVVQDYSHCVSLVDDADDFAEAVKNPVRNLKEKYDEILRKTSWDLTANKMTSIISEILA